MQPDEMTHEVTLYFDGVGVTLQLAISSTDEDEIRETLELMYPNAGVISFISLSEME